jgi:hypothetical protein
MICYGDRKILLVAMRNENRDTHQVFTVSNNHG